MTRVAMVGAPLVTVRLYGHLGARFGRVHRLAVSTVREAAQALSVLLPGFDRAIMAHGDGWHVFRDRLDGQDVGVDELDHPLGGRDRVCIVPAVAGSKRQGTFQVIVGVILIAVAAYFTGGASLSVTGAGAGLWGTVSAVGVSMALGGVVQMLSPQAKGNAAAADDRSNNFSDVSGTAGQGRAVPLAIGRCFVRGVPVSAGLSTDNFGAAGLAPWVPPPLPYGHSLNPLLSDEWSGPSDGGESGDGGGDAGDGGGD